MRLDLGPVPGPSLTSKTFVLEAYQQGLKHVAENIQIDQKRLESFGADLKKAYGKDVCDISLFNRKIIVKSTGLWIDINTKHLSCVICYSDAATLQDFLLSFAQYIIVNNRQSIDISYYYKNEHGIDFNSITLDQCKITKVYPELYPDIDIVALNDEFNSSNESLLFLTGEPGVGKTSFVRHMLKSFTPEIEQTVDSDQQPTSSAARVAYVKDMVIMVESEFWASLSSRQYDVIIFDDLDFALGTRQPGDNGFVNNLLSYSDGMLGVGSRIIITTNIDVKEIDAALLRPGRCFDFLTLKPLTGNEVNRIWTEVLEMKLEDANPAWAASKEVTQANLMSHYHRVSTDHRVRNYVRNGENVYSVEDKITRMLGVKRAGFNA